MTALRRLPLALAAACVLTEPAQANDNAVKAASDAFGTSVGRESIGLYTTGSVRGFSPTAAGNVRIDGLYFDQVWGVSARLRTASQVRVGLSAQGFVFPSPTGIVDHQLRRPGAQGEGQVSLTSDHWGGRYLDVDFSQPIKGTAWGVTGGLSAQRIRYGNGTHAQGANGSLALWWRPSPEREAMVFLSQHNTPFDQIAALVSPAAAALPQFDTQRRFQGPDWSYYRGTARNRGALWRETLAPEWQLRAGLFHSEFDDERGASHLIVQADATGLGQRQLTIDPASRNASDSGELRLSHTRRGAQWHQRWHLQWAGRERLRQYGGSARVDLGPGRVEDPVSAPEPAFAFGPLSQDRIRQQWLGLAYELRDGREWELNAGVQRTTYRKRLERPGLAAVEDRSQPVLGNLSGAWHWSPHLVAYAGLTRGLEESGIAPPNASNRNQAVPAILTTQRDAGLRWQLAPRLRWVAGVFEVQKPYFNLDAANLYTQLGEVRHRGFETSLAGHPMPELRLLVGALWMQPRVRGEAVTLGRVGERPLGQPERQLKLNAVWSPAALQGVSLDAGVSHTGPMAATRDNRVELPAVTLLDLGLRAPLHVGAQPLSLRLRVANATDRHYYELRGAGLYAEAPRRLVELTVSGSW
ncbi:TonB-dependent siderophore receptor [Inhella gelatinilytica]|uniref:TonB-dependent receptor n=1 Tax=Inhella gelatinilytica TaxID=2795030 RepID=A0A931IVM0_9BURK|nr:TonB-dependent receptor [Inhella gelatinilytica]MBH9551820.1 TonB-dependent receptor [Inhella gelatinilytica]